MLACAAAGGAAGRLPTHNSPRQGPGMEEMGGLDMARELEQELDFDCRIK